MREIYQSMRDGESLSDDEVKFAFGKFNSLANELRELGEVFHLSRVEATQRANQLRDWYLSRKGKDLYK